mmetsp:Transcript_16851/g.40024  ORF Transcript_16851/g.40024 Transcript_16851/m.40024 type:complete len:121 (+) Transcript_16851:319-681(+)|eukprot:CAMPEP_0175839140 /NCGR_PEP_ID=MMETSP0107_2-20121207/18642_1 /TAXON_ID=195067 ORGANISM="Goniomonas pacifica, Strain CCMP1869" /NCGR_SAMPLE_ID=MMETSP0107_2 /ASSEMBLY_ACC=CAM_ASM_000203 /LENGTH=120 /DNA_ID=CAMNT_0017152831 /DNA_START=325 /DNA_END=687 /DNA_ORIENTATION=-
MKGCAANTVKTVQCKDCDTEREDNKGVEESSPTPHRDNIDGSHTGRGKNSNIGPGPVCYVVAVHTKRKKEGVHERTVARCPAKSAESSGGDHTTSTLTTLRHTSLINGIGSFDIRRRYVG